MELVYLFVGGIIGLFVASLLAVSGRASLEEENGQLRSTVGDQLAEIKKLNNELAKRDIRAIGRRK